MKIGIIFTIYFFILHSASGKEQLVFAVDFIRHGERTPVVEIPNSPYEWGNKLGYLTEEGEKQEYHLGQLLREEYIKKEFLLPYEYHPETLYVRCTNFERTIKSARSLLKGLYPLNVKEGQTIIPLDISESTKEEALFTKENWNIFSTIKLYFLKRQLWKEKVQPLKETLQLLSHKTGMSLENFDELGRLADNLKIRMLKNVPLPMGVDKKSAEEIIALDELTTTEIIQYPEVSGESGKNTLKTIQTLIHEFLEGKKPLKYVLFSGHDVTLMTALVGLGVPFNKIPNFSSRLHFGVIKKEDEYFIKVEMNRKPVFIPSCKSHICSLEQWIAL